MYFFGVKASDDKLVICDALKRKVLKLSNIDAACFASNRLLSSKELSGIAKEHLPYLCDTKRFDALLKSQRKVYNSKSANITVAFSARCNLACKYCYEHPNHIGTDTINMGQLCAFIVNYVRANDISHLHVELYGGEPMLQKCEIRKLCAILKAEQIDFSLSMMTNGTIYDEQFFSDLVSSGLEKVEISIDGPESIHNFQRPMKNGGNCYEAVISNIKNICKFVPVVIRVNIGYNNIDYIHDLLDSLTACDLHSCCYIYFTPIINSPFSFNKREDFSKIGQCYIEARRKGFDIPMRIYATGPCYLQQKHSFAILPDNTIRKCIAISETEVGCTSCSNLSTLEHKEITKGCEKCDFYPICFGGCQYGDANCHQCPKELFEGILPYFLLSKIINENV